MKGGRPSMIAFANQKGGVGKTTSCVNLAYALAEKKKKTLLVDLDPQGNATSGLGIDKNKQEKTSYDMLIQKEKAANYVIPTGRKYLDLIPANINLAGAEIELVDVKEREYVFKKRMAELEKDYDFVLVDCPPSLSLLTLNALTAVSDVIIPVQAEYYALEGLTQLLETIESVRMTLNPDMKIMGAVVTMFDGRTQLSRSVLQEVENFFGKTMFKSFIPRNVRLSEAPSFGQSIFEYDKWSKGAKAYAAFAKEVIQRQKAEAK